MSIILNKRGKGHTNKMEEFKKKLLEGGINPSLVNLMTDEELKTAQTFKTVYDLESYLLALAIQNGIQVVFL